MTESALASAELREVHEERLTRNLRTYPLAPFLDDGALKRYVYYCNRYDSIRARDADDLLPKRFEETAYCKRLVAAHGSEIAARAVRNGSIETLSWMTGLTHRKADFSTAQLLHQLVREMRNPGWMSTFVGQTNSGKTNVSLLLAGLAMRDNPEMQFVTNITTVRWHEDDLQDRTHYVEKRSEVERICEEHADVFAVLDELSTQANAQTSNYDVNESLYPLITFKSKLGLRLVVIGHRQSGHDIAPAIREHSTHFVAMRVDEDSRGEKTYAAEFFEEVDDGEPRGEEFVLEPVPLVAAKYDPDETATFDITA